MAGPTHFIPVSQLLARGRAEGFIVCTEHGRNVNWLEFAQRTAAIARALSQRDERRWLIHCEQPVNFAASLLAVLHSERRAVVAPNLQQGMIEQLRPSYDGVLGDGPQPMLDVRALEPAPFRFGTLAPRAALIDLFTSGSSGEPKRVEKSLAQLETEAEVLESLWGAAIGQATMVATVPHHHIYGMLFRLIWPLTAGRPFDTALCVDPQLLLETLRRVRDVVVVSSPAHLIRLPELIQLESLKPATRWIFSSGAPLPAATGAEYQRRLGAPPTEVYGSTESGGIAWREQDGSDESAAWQPFSVVEVKLDPQGALCVRSPYLADDAWMTVGDAAELLPDGRFRLKGRMDRVVKVEGKRISLPQLEHSLRQHPWVTDAAIVPLSGGKEALGAVVVLREPGRAGEIRDRLIPDLRKYLLERFERVLVPRHWRFLERMPVDERGKLTAAALAELFRSADDAPVA
jgi:acyl-coenzyme A synthetase/AMP-(fatty) acid ligase